MATLSKLLWEIAGNALSRLVIVKIFWQDPHIPYEVRCQLI
jgi:hypothetical protein